MSILENPKYSYLIGKQPIFFRFWKKLFYYYCNTVFFFYTPVKVKGKKNLPSSSAIYCSNHNSHMDIAVLVYATRLGYEHFGFLAAKDYWFDNNFRRRLFQNFINLIPIERTNNPESLDLEDTFTLAKAFVSRNNNIVIFPEGERGQAGVMKRFRKGAMRFSVGLNIPIVPAVISGTEDAWPRKTRFMKPVPILSLIHISEPTRPY